MKQPEDISGGNRKTLPARKARKTTSQPAVLKQPARRRRVLRRGSDEELVKVFGNK